MKKKVVILFSGAGTNLLNIIKTLHKREVEVVGAITNRPKAEGIAKAKAHSIEVSVLDHTLYEDREAFDRALIDEINRFEPDLVVMAGFMRILTPIVTEKIRAINVHPSLLPLFKGGNAIQKSFESSETKGGISVHWVTSELDGGEVIAQASFEKDNAESLESFTEKIRHLEYKLLPETIVGILKSSES